MGFAAAHVLLVAVGPVVVTRQVQRTVNYVEQQFVARRPAKLLRLEGGGFGVAYASSTLYNYKGGNIALYRGIVKLSLTNSQIKRSQSFGIGCSTVPPGA